MTNAALIVAAGRGARAGGPVPKQWQWVAGARVLDHSLAVFSSHPRIDRVMLVLHPDDLDKCPEDVECTAGGTTRARSVARGLDALAAEEGCTRVLIHDVARPCVTPDLIDAVLDALDNAPGAAPALPVTDALWTGVNGRVTGTEDRTGLFRAQTPQGFHFDAIHKAHRANRDDAADDVAVARAAALDVVIVRGDEDNLKITHPDDFVRAERILEARHGHPARQRI